MLSSDKTRIAPPNLPRTYGLGDALKIGLREMWDRFGLTIGVSSTWSLALFIGLTVGQTLHFGVSPLLRGILAVALTALLLAPATAGVFGVAWAGLNHEPQNYGEFWRHARRFGGATLRLILLHALIVGLLTLNLWYYAHVCSAFGIAAALLSFDALVVWGLMAIYHFPLLVAQESGIFDTPDALPKRGLYPILRRSLYLALGRPAYAFGLLLAVALLTVILVATKGLFIILWSGMTAFLLSSGTRNLLIQYDVIAKPQGEEFRQD